ncbi:MAG: molybdopterin-dependent oxidoreductase [Acidimicrobiia bacterium]
MVAPPPRPDAVTTSVKTVCSYCGVGCGIVLDIGRDPSGRRVALRVWGDRDHPANAGRLCTKGATSADMLAAGGRMTTGLARDDRGGEPKACGTDAAISRAGRGLRRVLDEHGPDAIALYVSGQMTIEAQYLANKLAKGFIGTNQIESNSRLCMASAGSGYKLSLGSDGPPGSYDDFDHADVFLVIGSNMADCHPVLFLRLLDRVEAGAKLIVVDPRRTATADKADLFLQVRPGTDLAMLNGLLHLIVDEGAVDEDFVARFTEGWEDMGPLLADYPPAAVAAITGVPEADLRHAAALIAGAANWMSCWTMGLNQSTHGTWNTNALCNLHLATGAICRPGSGPFSLTGQPNAMGGREMGYMGPGLPGQRSVLVDDDRRFVEDLWGLPEGTVRTEVGTGTIDLFSRMADGRVKACWVICTNPIASVANRGSVIAGLEAAELVITQDAFVETETNAYADVILPAAMWVEGDGVMVNSERDLTLVPQAVDPPGEALPDWLLIARVACEMGFEEAFSYASAEEVFDEIARCSNPGTGYDLRGASYERLRAGPLQWPVAPDGPARNPIRYLSDAGGQPPGGGGNGGARRLWFATPNGRAVFHPRPHGHAAELPDDDFPFTFNTGRLAHQWHTMTKTGKVEKLNRLNPRPFVEIHPDDAARLGIGAGDQVEVASRRGRAVLPAVLSDRVRVGSCFAPFHWNDLYSEYASVNAVTNDAVDPISFQPEFKACAVSVTKVHSLPASPVEGSGGAARRRALVPTPAPEAALLSSLLALGDVEVPVLDDHERIYLSGFVAGLETLPARRGVPVLPPGAPLGGAATTWVNGLLAGAYSRAGTAATIGAVPVPVDRPARPRSVAVLWASQTGNAQHLAGAVATRFRYSGYAATLQAMGACTPASLPTDSDLLFVTSTFGSGDPPDNGAGFWRALSAPDAPRLDGVRYAVLALGDSSYTDFCGYGRRLDERLHELGATRLLPRVDCEPHFEPDAHAWLDEVLDALGKPAVARSAPSGDAPPFRACGPRQVPTRSAPLLARLAGNRILTGPGSAKEVRQLTIDIAGSGLTYEAGDSLGVWPTNCSDLVEEWLTLVGVARDAPVELEGVGPVGFASALRHHLEMARVTPDFLRFLAERTGDRELQLVLRAGDPDALSKWAWGRQAIDIAASFPVRAGAQEWADAFKRLQPRLYSISSSPRTDPHSIRLTTSVLRFEWLGRRRKGVCSTFLADNHLDAPVPVFVRSATHFRTPAAPSTPAVMIGPGTGIAPFLGFLDERRARGDDGRNWLFFGERQRRTDHFYEQELTTYQAEGVLDRLDLAFSRDQRTKVYVQDRMREHGAQLWSWLEDGAHVYVCGEMRSMAKDVDRALHDIVAAHGGLGHDGAVDYVQRLTNDNRYARDVY